LSPERWQQVSRIFRSALSLDAEARKVYVAEECGDDESLRSAVEKLIDSHQRADEENFIGGRAAEDGASLLIEENDEHDPPRVATGQHLGSYVILDRLGIGGMGEVYLARDSRLGRTVALKVLAPDVSADKRRMKRFRQEAKVASSLNQPNIITIYEFGEVDGLTFLATEYVDGETLRDYLRGRRAKLTEILDITIQILAALDAAHFARIVHRDIKPENVMVRRRDRVVKVLDFGLAKVTEKRMHGHTDRNRDRCIQNCSRHVDGNDQLHVTRAGAGARRRRADGHLEHGRDALRNVNWRDAVQWANNESHACPNHRERTTAFQQDPCGGNSR
jgi:serine/threonine protein kinase